MARGNVKKKQNDRNADLISTKKSTAKRVIQEKSPKQRKLFDSWQVIPHCPLSKRTVTPYKKSRQAELIKTQVTSLKQFIKTKLPKIKRKQLTKRRAIQVNTAELSVSQLIKITLTDYNSINYRSKVS